MFDAAAGAYTVQNRAVDSPAELPRSLDRRFDWELGAGLRLPSPLLWRLAYRGIAERPLPDGGSRYRGAWSVSVEYSW